MGIDFHDPKNQRSYATREVHSDWSSIIRTIVDPSGKRVADIGCGGGIYTKAWADLNADQVIGVDFSAQMVRAATEKTAEYANITIRMGDACATGLPDESVDIVFARALVHHLQDLDAFFREARRVLVKGGICIAQDRTPDDVQSAGSSEHIRGYFFEAFPRLLKVESERRPRQQSIESALQRAGLSGIRTKTMWETRRVYPDAEALADDLRGRTGRSILHELNDEELDELIQYVTGKVITPNPIIEKDPWTIWTGCKPE